MKRWLPWLAGAGIVFACAAFVVSGSLYTRLSSEQSRLLTAMIRLQKDQAALVNAREPLLQQFTTLATSTGNPQAAAANANETARLNREVQASADRWLADQKDFSRLTRHRQRQAIVIGSIALAVFLASLFLSRITFRT